MWEESRGNLKLESRMGKGMRRKKLNRHRGSSGGGRGHYWGWQGRGWGINGWGTALTQTCDQRCPGLACGGLGKEMVTAHGDTVLSVTHLLQERSGSLLLNRCTGQRRPGTLLPLSILVLAKGRSGEKQRPRLKCAGRGWGQTQLGVRLPCLLLCRFWASRAGPRQPLAGGAAAGSTSPLLPLFPNRESAGQFGEVVPPPYGKEP